MENCRAVTQSQYGNPFGYRGYRLDESTGLYILPYRDYDPSTGRFLSVDPSRDGLNWCMYVTGDPINAWDPQGLFWAEFGQGAIDFTRGVGDTITFDRTKYVREWLYGEDGEVQNDYAYIGGSVAGTGLSIALTGGLGTYAASGAQLARVAGVMQKGMMVGDAISGGYGLVHGTYGAITTGSGWSAAEAGLGALSLIGVRANLGKQGNISSKTTSFYAREGIDEAKGFRTLGSVKSVFEKTRLGDYRLVEQTLKIDPLLSGRAYYGTRIHELVHQASNRLLPNIARFKPHAGMAGWRGFIGSNVKFYEEALAYTIGNAIKGSSINGFKHAWKKSLRFKDDVERASRARRSVKYGVPIVAAGVVASAYSINNYVEYYGD